KWYPYGEVVGSTFQVYYGDSSGEVFTPGDTVELDHWEGMFPGDFNGDGLADLAHHNSFTDQLLTQLNEGGVLQASVETSLESLFYERIVLDVDGDGNDDLTHGGYHGEPAKLVVSNGEGAFTQTHTFDVPACYVTAGAWADYDGNGELDFAVVGDCNAILGVPPIAIHLQQDGVFSTVQEMPGVHAADPSEMVAGHFNDDGIVDLAVAGGQWPWDAAATIEIFHGNGDGTFKAPLTETFDMGSLAELRPTDANADGLQDLFVAVGTNVELLVNDGSDSFTRCVLSTEGSEKLRHAGDFNHDGIEDIVTTYLDENEEEAIRIWLSQP
ncbi:MAG: FG-GAP repeat domain-containing protein, partial [Nannocystaceae bacterium]